VSEFDRGHGSLNHPHSRLTTITTHCTSYRKLMIGFLLTAAHRRLVTGEFAFHSVVGCAHDLSVVTVAGHNVDSHNVESVTHTWFQNTGPNRCEKHLSCVLPVECF